MNMTGVWSILFDICGAPSCARWLCALLFVVCLTHEVKCEYNTHKSMITAIVNVTFKDPKTGDLISYEIEEGNYGAKSRHDSEWGWVVHTRSSDNKTEGCSEIVNVPKTRWIALIERGSCKFQEKIYNAAIEKNASAVVVYNNKVEKDLISMDHKVLDVVAIFINLQAGRKIADLVDSGIPVRMHISVGSPQHHPQDSINKTSVLFVTVSFIVLMIISLAWLVFYYIQRFRYAHAKERLSKRLMNAAKKAITKMPVRTMKNGDKEVENDYDQCAVCIENYNASDVVRILPCKHMFHKSCVDPWLIEQRSCPMCKLDILKAYGLQIHGSSCESMVNIDLEGASTSIEPSEFGLISHRGEHAPVEVIRFPPVSSSSSPPPPPPQSQPTTQAAPITSSSSAANAENVMSSAGDACVGGSTSAAAAASSESQSLVPKDRSSSTSSSSSLGNMGSVGVINKSDKLQDDSEASEGERAALISKGEAATLDD